jgi:hypothetical protein
MNSSGHSNKSRKSAAQMKRVYWRRRIAVVVVLILLIALVWGAVVSVRSVIGAVGDYLHRDDINAISKIPTPAPVQSSGVGDCTADDVSLGLTVQDSSVVESGSISFQVSITHKGTTICLIDASNVSRVLTVTSGSQKIWASNVCPVGSRQLLLAGNDKDTQIITWDTKQTGSKCSKTGTVTGGSAAKPGTYHAKLLLRDVPSVTSKQVTFTVTPSPPKKTPAQPKADSSQKSKTTKK